MGNRFHTSALRDCLSPSQSQWHLWAQTAHTNEDTEDARHFFFPLLLSQSRWGQAYHGSGNVTLRLWFLPLRTASRGTPLFSVCRPTPRSQSKKSYGVYHFPGKTRGKGIHHRSGKKGIHHRASDPEKEKKVGLHRWWCILFSSLSFRECVFGAKNACPQLPARHNLIALLMLGTEQVPQRNCVAKILPNVRVNFLMRLASIG